MVWKQSDCHIAGKVSITNLIKGSEEHMRDGKPLVGDVPHPVLRGSNSPIHFQYHDTNTTVFSQNVTNYKYGIEGIMRPYRSTTWWLQIRSMYVAIVTAY